MVAEDQVTEASPTIIDPWFGVSGFRRDGIRASRRSAAGKQLNIADGPRAVPCHQGAPHEVTRPNETRPACGPAPFAARLATQSSYRS